MYNKVMIKKGENRIRHLLVPTRQVVAFYQFMTHLKLSHVITRTEEAKRTKKRLAEHMPV